ncbi:hypothetical protein JCM11491_005448 [Sporobolomyces phaffii]
MSDSRPSLSQLQAAVELDSGDDDFDAATLLNKPLASPPPSRSAKGKAKATEPETIHLDSSDDQDGPDPFRARTSRPSTSKVPSVSSLSKKHAFHLSESDDDSDLEILSSSFCPVASTSTSTPSSRLHTDKKPRLVSPRVPASSPSSAPASIKALHSSVNALIVSYSLRRVTRPEFISKKLEFRDEARELGLDFDAEFGPKFLELEPGVHASAAKDKGKGKAKGERDLKGKGKAIATPGRDLDDVGTIVDRRMTSAQVRAKQGAVGGGNKKGSRTNAQILAIKKREWDEAKIVPLTVANAGRMLGGVNGINREAMERAKRRKMDRDAKRRRELRKKGSKGGIDGWLEGALAGPAPVQDQDQDQGMPGAWNGQAGRESSGSGSSDDSDVDYSEPDDDRKILARLTKLKKSSRRSSQAMPKVTAASQENAAFHRRQQNASMRSTKAVDEAVAALGMRSKKECIPGMTQKLLDFQFIGLAFMVKREMDPKVPGGILADEMGLGKTVQTIALMMARRSHDPEIKANLIVVPLSLLSQWEDEIEKFAIGQSVHIYHGSNKHKTKSRDELVKFDVVITTHSTLSLEWPKSKKKKKKKDGEPEEEEEKEEEKDPGLLFQVCWYRVIVDEAHVARNPSARISKAISKLDAVFRWALTGTPMINSLRDYFPLHRFLRNRPWKEYKYYQKAITVMEKKHPVEAGRLADGAIGPLTLRRRKTDQLGGKALVELPPKSERLVTLEFEPVEREIYDHIEAGFQTKVNKFFRAGTLLKNFHFILVLILRLKQLAVHPHLMAERVGAYNRVAELERATKVLGKVVVERLRKQRLDVAVNRAAVDHDLEDPEYVDDGTCPVCSEPIMNYAGDGSVTPCGHVFCTSCIQEVLHEPAEDDMGDPRGRKCKKGEAPCPLCRAPFSEKTLFDLECFEATQDEVDAALELREQEPASVNDVKPRLQDKNGKGKAKEEPIEFSSSRFIELTDDEDEDLPDPSTFFDMKPKIKPEHGDVKPKIGGSASRVKKEEKDVKPRFGSPSVRDIKPLPTSSSATKVKQEKKIKKDDDAQDEAELQMSPLVPSTKMAYILKKLRQFEAEDAQKRDDIATGKYKPVEDEPEPDTRAIILSQFVGALDLLDRYLTENGIMSVRFQGSTSADERRDAIRLLGRKQGGVRVMLLSTKAGGVGLNLTSACRVLSLDLAWSKAVEAQAFDRTYRLGQLRPVEIERIIVRDTIEERILNLQARKTLLSDMSLAEGQGDPDYVGNISVPDILSLFRLDKNGNRESPGGGGAGGGGRGGRGGTPRGRGRGGFRGGGGRDGPY